MVRQQGHRQTDSSERRSRLECVNSGVGSQVTFALVFVTVLSSAGIAGIGIMPVSGVTQNDVAAECQLDRATPESVMNLRERAKQRVGELRALKANSTVPVSKSIVSSAASRVKDGNLSYDRARYRRACGHYQIALNQSKAALKRHYTELARIRLSSVQDYISARRTAGYDSVALSNLSARRESLAARTENISSLSQARAVTAEATNLLADTKERLPATRTVRVADAIAPLWGSVPAALGLSIIIGAIGAFVGRWTADGTDGGTTSEKEKDIETRNDRFGSNPRK